MPTPRWWPRCRSTAGTTGSPPGAPDARSSSRSCRSSLSRNRSASTSRCMSTRHRSSGYDPDAPPFFILHGEDDSIIPVPEGREFAEAMRDTSTSVVAYAEIPHAQHAFDFYYGSPRGHYTARAVEEFLSWVHAKREAASVASYDTRNLARRELVASAADAQAPSPSQRPSALRKGLRPGGFRRTHRSSRRSTRVDPTRWPRRTAPKC